MLCTRTNIVDTQHGQHVYGTRGETSRQNLAWHAAEAEPRCVCARGRTSIGARPRQNLELARAQGRTSRGACPRQIASGGRTSIGARPKQNLVSAWRVPQAQPRLVPNTQHEWHERYHCRHKRGTGERDSMSIAPAARPQLPSAPGNTRTGTRPRQSLNWRAPQAEPRIGAHPAQNLAGCVPKTGCLRRQNLDWRAPEAESRFRLVCAPSTTSIRADHPT